MGVDAGVARGAGQALVFPVRNVLERFAVPVLLCEAKIDHVHNVATASRAHEEVVGLDVTMQEVLVVYILDPRNLQ